MEENTLSGLLKSEAINLEACEKGLDGWGGQESQQELIDRFKKHSDFCMKTNWPSTEFIKSNFDDDIMAKNNIYIDKELDIDKGLNGIWFLYGECTGKIYFDEYAAATVHIMHNCKVNIMAFDNAKVFVMIHDNAKANVLAEGTSKIRVITYGENARVSYSGNVTVKRK